VNTFNNTFDLTYRPSPVPTLPSPGSSALRKAVARPASPISRKPDQPYALNLPFGVRPILKNSPLPRDLRRPSVSASPRVSGRRVFFPAPKKVAFRAELVDEIVTSRYILRHVDLSSSEDESASSGSDDQNNNSSDEESSQAQQISIVVDEVSVRGRSKRKAVSVSSSPANKTELEAEDRARGSSARRSKRKRRRWEWTLDSKIIQEPLSATGKTATHEERLANDTPELAKTVNEPASKTAS
jgi:hypothetical protein